MIVLGFIQILLHCLYPNSHSFKKGLKRRETQRLEYSMVHYFEYIVNRSYTNMNYSDFTVVCTIFRNSNSQGIEEELSILAGQKKRRIEPFSRSILQGMQSILIFNWFLRIFLLVGSVKESGDHGSRQFPKEFEVAILLRTR